MSFLSGDGFVNAWMDTNQDDVWDASEQILTDAVVTAGVNTLFYTIPAIPAGTGDFVAITRFRLNSTGGLSPTGPAEDGEVEDYGLLVQEVILPDDEGGEDGVFTFTETVQPRVRRAYDPAVAGGYDYTVTGSTFATVELPLLGFGDESYELSYEGPDGPVTTTLEAGIEFDFELAIPARSFRRRHLLPRTRH